LRKGIKSTFYIFSMWNWIESVILSVVVITLGHFFWQMLRDSFSKPIVKSFVTEAEKSEEAAQIINNYVPSQPVKETVESELDDYLKSKLNVLNTTDINELSTHYDSPGSQEALSQN